MDLFGVSLSDFEESANTVRSEATTFRCHIHGADHVGVCSKHWDVICRVCGRCDGCMADGLGEDL